MPGENLLASILFHEVPSEAMELPRRVCLATVDACRLFTVARLALKWPNDVLLDDRKLAGVLAQRSAGGSVVVGIGVNVGWAPDGAGRLGSGRRAAALARRASRRLRPPARAPPTSCVTATVPSWRRSAGAFVSSYPTERLLGVATDLAFDGRLVVVDDAGTAHRLSVGDVVHLRVQ